MASACVMTQELLYFWMPLSVSAFCSDGKVPYGIVQDNNHMLHMVFILCSVSVNPNFSIHFLCSISPEIGSYSYYPLQNILVGEFSYQVFSGDCCLACRWSCAYGKRIGCTNCGPSFCCFSQG